MNLAELSKELDTALALKKHNTEINKRCRQLQVKINKLEKLLEKVKRDLIKVRSDPDKLIDVADEALLCRLGVKLRFDSYINGSRVLKVNSPRFNKSYKVQEGEEKSILREAINAIRDHAW